MAENFTDLEIGLTCQITNTPTRCVAFIVQVESSMVFWCRIAQPWIC